MMHVNHNNRIFRGDFLKLSDKEKKMLQGAVAPTIVATLIFLITYFFFGMENTMIGPFATLSFLRCRNMCSHYECLIRNFSVYMIMAVLSFLAVLNLPLCIIVNAIALFWIACLLIDEYNPNNYFPAGMALIFSRSHRRIQHLTLETVCWLFWQVLASLFYLPGFFL